MDDLLEVVAENFAQLKVMGVGGGGSNAVDRMVEAGVKGVEFIAVNTDAQALLHSAAPRRIRIGDKLTKGLGSGGNPVIGQKAAEESSDELSDVMRGADMVFITAGMGGGTGTGGAPIVAQVCKETGALTVAVVTKPFLVEGKVRQRNAEEGLKALQGVVDTLISIPNNRLLCLADRRSTFLECFRRVDDVLLYAVKGVSDLITHPGYINVDFADVRTVMAEMGMALMGTGVGRGENRAAQAAQQAISSPLLEDISIHGARAVLVNISASDDLGMHEFEEASSIIQKEVDEEANIFLGVAVDQDLEDEIRITVIATGIGKIEQAPKVEVPGRPKRRGDGLVPDLNYDYLQIPTVVRHRSGRDSQAMEQPKRRTLLQKLTGVSADEEDLSIPTFIRKQMD